MFCLGAQCYLRSPGWWCKAPEMAGRPTPGLWDWNPAVYWDPPRSCACLLSLVVDYELRDTWSPILRVREAKDKCIMMPWTDLTAKAIMPLHRASCHVWENLCPLLLRFVFTVDVCFLYRRQCRGQPVGPSGESLGPVTAAGGHSPTSHPTPTARRNINLLKQENNSKTNTNIDHDSSSLHF